MAAWNGWPSDLLAALGAPDTAKNRVWLEEWEKFEHTTCRDNPLSATPKLSGSTKCTKLASGAHAQAYTSHAQGIKATHAQLAKAAFKPIRDCLASGDPSSYKDWQLVVGALGTWEAHGFANQYANAMKGLGQGGIGGSSDATRSLHAYSHFANVAAHKVPANLHRAQRLNRDTLAKLGR